MKMINKIVKSLIVLSVVLGVSQAEAAGVENNNSNIYLTQGTDSSFKSYMNQKAKRFVKKNDADWSKFNEIVQIYNTSKGKFMNLSDYQKEYFYDAVDAIKGKLGKMHSEEAKLWLKKVDVTEKVYTFLWNNKVDFVPAEYMIETPTVVIEHAALGR
jgi:hypothetical protein